MYLFCHNNKVGLSGKRYEQDNVFFNCFSMPAGNLFPV